MLVPQVDDLDELTRPRRVLVIDFERLPGLAHVFDPRPRYLPPAKWLRHPSTLCFAARWHGEKRTRFHAAWHDGGWDAMVAAHWDYYDRADVVVTYYGTGADNKWARQDWDLAKMPDPRPWKDVDLYRLNKSRWAWESGSLDYLTQRLSLAHKQGHYDATEAEAAHNGDPAAQRRLRRYNISDVAATLDTFERFRLKLGTRMPHAGLFAGTDRCCWNCGGEEFEPIGDVVAVTLTYAAYRCRGCGAESRSTASRRRQKLRAVAR